MGLLQHEFGFRLRPQEKVKLNAIPPTSRPWTPRKARAVTGTTLWAGRASRSTGTAGGGDVNRATASGRMGTPTLKMLTMKQRVVK